MTDPTLADRVEASLGSTAIRNDRDWAQRTRNTLELDALRTQGALRALHGLLCGRDLAANDPRPEDLGCLVAIIVEHMDMVVDNISALAPHV